MKFNEIPTNTPNDVFVFIECDITGKTKKTRYGVAKANVIKNNGQYITNWGLAKLNNPMKQQSVKDKVKQTNLDRYGTVMPMNSAENIEKRSKMFEDEEFVAKRAQKIKETSLVKYGVEHPMKSEEIQNKQKQVMQEKYGVDHPLQNKEIKEKTRQTCQERYGVDNVGQIPEVQIKMAQTTLKKYGVERYNQLPEMKDYLRENCKEWLKESYANPWNKGIPLTEKTKEKARETIKNRILAGNWHGGFKSNCRGWYPAKNCRKNMPRFLSALELQLHFFLDNHPKLEWYNYESISIPYLKQDGTKHLYFPDFLVKYLNNPVVNILETKFWKNKDSLDVKNKQDAAINYANKNNMIYILLFDEDIIELGLDIEKIKSIPGLILENNS